MQHANIAECRKASNRCPSVSIISRPTVAENLCVACFNCNTFKSSHVAGYQPGTDDIHALLNPRTHAWDEHFEWDGPTLNGKTPIGRSTVDVLRINMADRVEQRRILIAAAASFHLALKNSPWSNGDMMDNRAVKLNFALLS